MIDDIITVNVTVGWLSRSYVWSKADAEKVRGSFKEPATQVGIIAKSLFLAALTQIERDGQRDRLEYLPDPRIEVSVRVASRKYHQPVFMMTENLRSLSIPNLVIKVDSAARGCYHIACGDLDTDAAAMDDPHDDPDLAEIPKGADYGTS